MCKEAKRKNKKSKNETRKPLMSGQVSTCLHVSPSWQQSICSLFKTKLNETNKKTKNQIYLDNTFGSIVDKNSLTSNYLQVVEMQLSCGVILT